MRDHYTLARLYVQADLIQTESGEGATLELSVAQGHYLLGVLRKRLGDSLRVFNGRDGEWRAQIAISDKRHAALRLIEPIREQKNCPDLMLCFAPIKPKRNSFVVEKATELGVSIIQPVITARTQAKALKLDKLRAQTIEAAEQTERLDIPTLRDALSLADMLGQWGAEEKTARPLIFADEAGGCASAMEALSGLGARGCMLPSAILIGPEGGFTEDERAMLRAHEFVVPVALGPRILRADTAALSLLTLWQSVIGDW